MGADAAGAAGHAEIVGQCRADNQTEDKNGGVVVAFARHEELATGTAACQCEGQSGRDHAHEVPQMIAVGDGLLCPAESGETKDLTHERRCREHGEQAQGQMPLSEQQEVTDGAHGAEAAALGQKTHDQSRAQRKQEGSVLGTGSLDRIEEHAALGLALDLRVHEVEDH